MASNYDFRILIETVSGSNISYGTSSLVSVQPNTSLVVNTDEMVNKINTMESITVFNGKTHTTASSLFNVSQSNRTFFDTGIDGSSTDYQFVSASIKGSSDSGSILFHANSTPTVGGDFVKRYKFFGNKVCNVLGVPENYWIYADKFRLTNTGSEQNYISGDVLAQSLHLRDNFAISNAGAIESDLPMKHAKDTDRWIKWTDVSSSIPQNDMLIGYSNQSDKYMIRMQNNEDLIISSSAITASNDIFLPNGDLIGNLNSTKLSNINQLEVNTIFGTDDDTDTGISFAGNDTITMVAGGITAFSITGQSTPPSIALGNTSTDIDFRVDAGVANSLFITSSNQNVGIGTNSPIYKLQVEGDISSSGDLFLPRYSSLRLGSTTTKGAVSIESGSNALLGTGSAGADASNPSNYHLQLRDVENATGNGIGIGFAISSNQASLGASIIHVREDTNSVGRLEFHTNGSDTGTGIVTPRVIIDNTGDMIVSQSLEVQENFTVAGTFNPSTISTNVFTASTFNLGSDTAEEHAIQGVSSLTQNGGGFIGNSNGMIRGHEVGSTTHGDPSNFKYFFCGYLDEGDSGTYEQMFIDVYGGRYSYNQAGITKYQITSRGSDGENDFEIYRQRYGSFTFDGEKFDIKILRNGTVNEKRYGVFIYNTTDQFPNFSVRAWKLTNNDTGQMQEIMVKEFESTLSGSSQPFDGYSDTESLVERYNTFEVNRDKVGINTTNPSQKLTVSGSIEIDDGDLRFDVGSGDTHGIDFDGEAAIRLDKDNNKVLIERTNGSGVPNQPIITIPTNTSDDVVATVDGHISASRFLGFTPWLLNGGGNWSGASTVWLELGGGGSESSGHPSTHERRWIAPYDGYIERIVSRVANDVTAIKFRPYKNTTDDNNDVDSLDQEGQYTAMGSQVSISTGAGHNQRVVHTFGTSYSFSTGDAIALECQTTGDGPDDLDITMVVMLNITA